MTNEELQKIKERTKKAEQLLRDISNLSSADDIISSYDGCSGLFIDFKNGRVHPNAPSSRSLDGLAKEFTGLLRNKILDMLREAIKTTKEELSQI